MGEACQGMGYLAGKAHSYSNSIDNKHLVLIIIISKSGWLMA